MEGLAPLAIFQKVGKRSRRSGNARSLAADERWPLASGGRLGFGGSGLWVRREGQVGGEEAGHSRTPGTSAAGRALSVQPISASTAWCKAPG